ncbi:MAG: hypothetical protein GY711_02990 [bacterium]|nr:hypothetical protein [bacterium]
MARASHRPGSTCDGDHNKRFASFALSPFGAFTASDALFAIGGDPDRYSASGRGVDTSIYSLEHVCLRSNNTVDFQVFVPSSDLVDFRVIAVDLTSLPRPTGSK